MYCPYTSQSKNPNCQAYIPKAIEESISYFFQSLLRDIKTDIDTYCQNKLGFSSKEALYQCLSAEQIDAVSTIIYQIEKKNALILADETGVGKGRTLASIYKYCKKNNKKVLFFTYNKDLFSDFVRDLTDIEENDYSKIWVVHNKTIVYDTQENIVFKASKTKNTKRINDLDTSGIDLMFCTYSQVNSTKQKQKMEFLLKYCQEDTVIVLDESHNACGNSNTRKNIEKLIAKSISCVYASATFLKNEQEFDLYKRALESIDAENLKFFKTTLENENSLDLRSYITKFLISKGRLIRREHSPMNTSWEHHIIDFSKYTDRFESVREVFAKTFNIIEDTKKYSMVYENLKSAWFSSGAHINRIFKNLLLLNKIDDLCFEIEKDVKNNKKPVIVMESTFSAIINELINNDILLESQEMDNSIPEENETEEEIDEKNYDKDFSQKLTLQNYLSIIVEKILLKSLPKFGLAQEIYDKIEDLKKTILNMDDKWCILSPIDLIVKKLSEKDISCVEISGRDFYLDLIDNSQILRKKQTSSKTRLINSFNDGTYTCAIITRTGSTGFSMHASEKFKDQRQRILYELEISNRPTVRVQFVGRVRRKGQVSEPGFKTIISNLPFEARLVENEQEKMRKMSSHISTDHTRLIGENIINLYSQEADFLAKQILSLNTKLAEKMGIALNAKSTDFYFIDMLLKRSVVLPIETADKLYDYILEGLKISNQRSKIDFEHNYQLVEQKPFCSYMNDNERSAFKDQWIKNKLFGFNNVDFNFSSLSKISYEIENRQISANELKNIYQFSKDIEASSRDTLSKTLKALLANYNPHYHYYQNLLNNLSLLKKGSYISFNTSIGNVFGFIEEIVEPEQPYLKYYPTHYLVKIRSLNFDKIPKNSAYENLLTMTLNDLIFCEKLVFRKNETVEFSKFEQSAKKYQIEQWAIFGNPIFISYLNFIYKIGQTTEIVLNGQKYFAVLIGKDISDEVLFQLRQPVFDIKDIYKLILEKKTIYTSPSKNYEGAIRLEPSTGSVIIYSTNYNDKNIFDFPLYNVIGSGTYQGKNEKKYILGFKDLIKVCAMLNKRNVYFFVDKK